MLVVAQRIGLANFPESLWEGFADVTIGREFEGRLAVSRRNRIFVGSRSGWFRGFSRINWNRWIQTTICNIGQATRYALRADFQFPRSWTIKLQLANAISTLLRGKMNISRCHRLNQNVNPRALAGETRIRGEGRGKMEETGNKMKKILDPVALSMSLDRWRSTTNTPGVFER